MAVGAQGAAAGAQGAAAGARGAAAGARGATAGTSKGARAAGWAASAHLGVLNWARLGFCAP